MSKGILNPKNHVETSGGGFKEGNIRVDSSVFKVHQGRSADDQPARQPVLALAWGVTRLDEDGQALTNEDGEEIHEELVFGLGGKSLNQVHPGIASSVTDTDVEDAGTEVNAEGQTMFLVNEDFKLNRKSGCSVLMKSIQDAGWKDEHFDSDWAPTFVGCVFHMKTQLDDTMKMADKNGVERAVPYKVVDKILSRGYEKTGGAAKKAAGKSNGAGAANGSGANPEAEARLKPILEHLSTELDGTEMTRKALTLKVSGLLQSGDYKADPKLHVPILGLVKDDKWLTKNGTAFDLTYNADKNTVVFGTINA